METANYQRDTENEVLLPMEKKLLRVWKGTFWKSKGLPQTELAELAQTKNMLGLCPGF